MKKTLALIALAAAGLMFVAGCGGDDGNEADVKAITALVTELNRVTSERDATGFCAVMEPEGMKKTFNSKKRCVQETTQILKQAGKQPVLKVDAVTVDGDNALVKFEDKNGEAPLVKKNGKWYVPLDAAPAEAEATESSSSDSAQATLEDSEEAATGSDNGNGN